MRNLQEIMASEINLSHPANYQAVIDQDFDDDVIYFAPVPVMIDGEYEA